MALGVDVGGTFTDLVSWDGRGLHVGKTPSTADQSEGLVRGAGDLLGGRPASVLLHGTTVATNAVLERRGARTAIVTDAGFADLIEIARQDRPSLYDSFADRPAPLVGRDGRFGIAAGDAGAIDGLVSGVAAYGPESVAVSFLYAHERPGFEDAVADRLAERLGVPVSRSHEVVGEFREFERLSTTTLNAYLMPAVGRYLTGLQERAAGAGLPADVEVLRSSGGLMPVPEACRLPAAVLLSGPAGGVVAAAAIGELLGLETLVSFDMGGTSTDVCRIDGGRPEVSYERSVDGFPCRLPSVAVHTVGAGGGSVGWVDGGGALRVGPVSAGAEPGPACYGRGGDRATVTDANVRLGRLDPRGRLAGGIALDGAAAGRALRRLGGRAGLDEEETALGIVEIAEAHMARAIRTVSVEQGADPRDAVLVSFGGAGGLHATALARRLEMAGVVIPPYAGVFSAVGLLLSPRRTDRSLSVRIGPDGWERLEAVAREVAGTALGKMDAAESEAALRLDVRYAGQAHETTVPYRSGESWDAIAERFHTEHAARNGFARPEAPFEIVTVRAEVTAPAVLRWEQLPPFVPSGEPSRGSRRVRVASGEVDAAVWWRPALAPGFVVEGPAVIEEPEATAFLGPGERARVHASGALEVSW